MTTTKFTGSKYEATRGLDLSEVAKLIRADIKAAVEAGSLPAGLLCSVRISRYSMGQSLNVRVVRVPAGFAVKVSEEQADDNRTEGLAYPWMTREAHAVLSTLEGIVEAYDRSETDAQSDYFNCRFHGSVDFDSAVERGEVPAPRKASRKAAPVVAEAVEAPAANDDAMRALELANARCLAAARVAVAERNVEAAEVALRDAEMGAYLAIVRDLGAFAGVA